MNIWVSLKATFMALGLMIKVPKYLIQWRLRRGRAKSCFRKELIASGVPPEEASELTELFPFDMGELIATVRSTR
ncbi:MAG: hypothetical protein NWE89_13320 [Candidatus Bathyarchaeota archaeon]|nr:hypothetical protein [Candidatus Bathyarchaeota archaeon]